MRGGGSERIEGDGVPGRRVHPCLGFAKWGKTGRAEKEKMEPRGFEPRSRSSQHDASTRVSGGLISITRAAASSIPDDPASSIFSPARLEAPLAGQPDVLRSPPHRASGGNRAA